MQPVYGLVTEIARANYPPQVEELAALYVAEAQKYSRRGPISWGACRLEASSRLKWPSKCTLSARKLRLLALFDTPTPWAFTCKPLFPRLVGHLRNVRRFGFGYLLKKLGRRLKSLRQIVSTKSGMSAESQSDVIADTGRLRQVFTTTADQYDLRLYPGRATLFVLADRDGMSDSLFDPSLGEIDPQLGWGRIAAGGVEVHEVHGEHTSIFHEPNVRSLAEKLTYCLEMARETTPKYSEWSLPAFSFNSSQARHVDVRRQSQPTATWRRLLSRPSHDRASPSIVCDALRFLSFPTPLPRQQPPIRPASPYILICPKYSVYFPSSFSHLQMM